MSKTGDGDSTLVARYLRCVNSRYEIEEASEFLEPVDGSKVGALLSHDDEDDYQVSLSSVYLTTSIK